MAKHRRVKPEVLESVRQALDADRHERLKAHAAGLGLSVARLHRLLHKHQADQARENAGNRFAAAYAHQSVLFGAQESRHFSVVRELADGDWLLRLAPRRAGEGDSLRRGQGVFAYSFWDLFSGYQWDAYAVAKDVNGYDALAAFAAFCGPKSDPNDPVQGVPGQLRVEPGLIDRLGTSVDLFERLGVDIAGAAGNGGVVECAHRSRWDFERIFYVALASANAPTSEITLSELNARRAAHRARLNGQPARWNPALTKLQAWRQSAAERAGAGNPIPRWPENPLDTLMALAPKPGPSALAGSAEEPCHATLGDALRAFLNMLGHPDFAYDHPEEFDSAVEMIAGSGLDKNYTRSLALDLRKALKKNSLSTAEKIRADLSSLPRDAWPAYMAREAKRTGIHLEVFHREARRASPARP